MNKGILYILLGGVSGFMAYTYLQMKKREAEKLSVKDDKKNANKAEGVKSFSGDLVNPHSMEELMMNFDHTSEHKPIFDPIIDRQFDINREPAKPKMTIYDGKLPRKKVTDLQDFEVRKESKNIRIIPYR
jgi:hypothetical protein